MEISGTQKISRFFSSKKTFEKIKIESMSWGFSCKSCNERTSIWELGGVRYKAKGEPLKRLPCPKCNEIAMQKITKLEQ